jgi:ABC-type multidrug transport system fused ATPase/permease subunit
MQEEELKQKSEKISELLGETFNDELSSALTMNSYLNTALINSSYTTELLKGYTEKNSELQLSLRNRHGDILTNDRKTYYETDALNNLQSWYKLWWYLYYMLVLVLIISLIMSPNSLSLVKKVVLSIILIGYPYFIDYIVKWIKWLFMSIYSNLPKNVYNDL